MLQMTKLTKTIIQDRVRFRVFILVLCFSSTGAFSLPLAAPDVILKRGAARRAQAQGTRTVYAHGSAIARSVVLSDYNDSIQLKVCD